MTLKVAGVSLDTFGVALRDLGNARSTFMYSRARAADEARPPATPAKSSNAAASMVANV